MSDSVHWDSGRYPQQDGKVVEMSGVDEEVPLPEVRIAAEGSTYAHLFLDACRRFKDRPALRWKEADQWQEISFAQLEQRVLACAAALSARGVGTGDRVAIWLENSWHWIGCDLAVQLIGAVTTTVYHTLIPTQALALLRDAEATVILANQERLKGLFECDGISEDSILAISVDEGPAGQLMDALLKEGERVLRDQPEVGTRLRNPRVQPADLSALFYTSGTTGEPKGAMLTHANVAFNANRTISQMLTNGTQVALLHLPLAHVMARNTTVPATLFTGSVLAIAEPQREKIPGNLIEVAPTAFPTVPHLLDKFMQRAMEAIAAKGPVTRHLALWAVYHCRRRRLAALAQAGEVRPPKLGLVGTVLDYLVLRQLRAKLGGNMQFIVTGGANSNRQSVEFFWGIGVPVYEGYGATELTGTSAITWARAMKLGTVGKRVPGVELKLNPDGEILFRGPIVMKGYWQRPEETAKAIDADGWYHTGDIGTLDKEGYLTILDRKREILVLTTGKNIAPQAIEGALGRSLFIRSVCAIGHRRSYTTALIVPDLAAAQQRLKLGEPPRMNDPEVSAVLKEEVRSLMSNFSHFERVKRFVLVSPSFSPENQLATPTLKLQRRRIADRFANEIEDLYANSPQSAIVVDYGV